MNGKKYFVKNSKLTNIIKNAIPWEKHVLEKEVQQLTAELEDLEKQPDEILVPNEEKMRIDDVRHQLKEAKQRLKQWQR